MYELAAQSLVHSIDQLFFKKTKVVQPTGIGHMDKQHIAFEGRWAGIGCDGCTDGVFP